MAKLKQGSTVEVDGVEHPIWTEADNSILSNDPIQVVGLSDDFSQLAKMVASNPTTNNRFGWSVDSTDTRIVIGSKDEATGGAGTGAIYIFDITGKQLAMIQASDAEAVAYFGWAVAVSKDRIVVGSPNKDIGGAIDFGAVYIFDLDGNELTKIIAPDGLAGDKFGTSVTVSDNRIVVGAPYSDGATSNEGSAYVFDIDGVFITKILPSDKVTSGMFGNAVAVSKDKIVVGEYGDNVGGSYRGAAYIYDIDGKLIGKLTASDAEDGDTFGHSVAVSDNRIVISANQEDTGGANAGAVYIFDVDGIMIVKIQASDAQATDYFGQSVAVTNNRITVSAMGEDTVASNAGAAYIFDIDGNELSKIQADDAGLNYSFGNALSISDSRIVVCSYREGAGGTETGAAYIFKNFRNDLIEITNTVYEKTGVTLKI